MSENLDKLRGFDGDASESATLDTGATYSLHWEQPDTNGSGAASYGSKEPALEAARSIGFDEQLSLQVARITAAFPGLAIPTIAASGNTTLLLADSLTADDVRGVVVDPDPPALQTAEFSDPDLGDDFAAGAAPYDPDSIDAFRLRYFTLINQYTGYHTWNMAEQLGLHGFVAMHVYGGGLGEDDWAAHMPRRTRFYRQAGFTFSTWMDANGYTAGRYDELPDAETLADEITASGTDVAFLHWTNPEQLAHTNIDLEHGILSPSSLQAQAWYPSAGTTEEKAQFEADYYAGVASTYAAWMILAQRGGFAGYGIYGWAPFARQWSGLETATDDPANANNWRWQRYGSLVYDEVDTLYPSVYCFYWDERNLAYMLANIDLSVGLASNAGKASKPLLPYVWNLLHGGGNGWRWWRQKPIADNEMQAYGAALFFSQIDGFVLWGWSGTNDPHRVTVQVCGSGTDHDGYVIEVPFTETGSDTNDRSFAQYDVIYVTAIDGSDNVTYKYIDKADPSSSLASSVTYTTARATLEPNLRPDTAGLDAFIDGIALAQVFEYLLWEGSVEIDVPATTQFGSSLPVVRRVKLDPYHVIFAYDPFFADYPSGRDVVLSDFDGVVGRTLTIPTDGTARIWLAVDA